MPDLTGRLAGGSPAITRRRFSTAVLPFTLIVSLVMPLTVSCQRKSSDPNRGLAELRSLVQNAQEHPAPGDLERIESAYPRSRAAALARFLRGYQYYTSQNYAAAIDALDSRAIGDATAIGDYAFFCRAESEAAAGARKDALSDYSAVVSKYPDSLKTRDAKLGAAQMALALGDLDGVRREIGRMAEAGDADALYLSAQVYERSDKLDEAGRLYRQIYYDHAATRAAVQAEQRLTALGLAPKEHPGTLEEEKARDNALLESKQFNDAAQGYSDLLSRFPEAASNDSIQLALGRSLLGAKQPAQAVPPLARVSEANANLKSEALFHQAEALRRSNRAAESGAIVDRLLKQYPKTTWAQEALYSLARDLDKADRDAEAMSRYRQLLAFYPKGSYAAEASYSLGWYAYRMKQYAEAARLLEQHLATYRYPDTKFIGESGFWGAKAEERLGNRARALALYDLVSERYRYGYHGYLAGMRAARLRAGDASLRAETAKPGADLERIRKNVTYVEQIEETADGSETPRFAKADDLETIGLGEAVIKELNAALEKAPTSPKINLRIAQYYSRRGDNFQATIVLRRGYPDIYSYKEADVPREAWEIFFPIVAWDTIKQEAKRYGIDPYIAAGLIRQESVFSPTATSRVGARGLMQVMPATGQQIARKQGSGSITASDLYNPTINVKLGMNYWAQMIGQFGRVEYAAAAYNAGPGRARAWIAARGGLDIEDWIETIPFSETRGYVQGVLRYAANYRRFYKE